MRDYSTFERKSEPAEDIVPRKEEYLTDYPSVGPFICLRLLSQLLSLKEYKSVKHLKLKYTLDTRSGVPLNEYSFGHVVELLLRQLEEQTFDGMWLLKTTVVLLCSAFEHMTWTQQLLSESMDLIDWYIYNSQDTDEQLLHNLQLVYLKMSHAPSTIVVFGPAHDTTSFQDLYTRLKLSYSLTFCDFSYHCTKLLPELFNNRNLLIKISKREASEIDHACRFLVSRDKQDVSSASKWFRVSGSAQIRRQMQTNGFGNYSKANKVDAVSASYYIKGILQSINNGLIPSVIRQLLIDLLHPYIDAKSIPTNVIAACYGLLSLHPVKFQILRSLCSVTDRILQEGTLDPISPKDLARVLKVSDDSIYEPLTQTELTPSEMKHINQELDRWNHVFGLILSNSKEFLYQEQYENTLASMSQMLYSQ